MYFSEPGPVRDWQEVHRLKGNDMKLTATVLSACAVLALAACSSAPVSAPAPAAAAKPTFQAKITEFGDAKVNEAASAYVSSYKQAIEESLQTGKYQRELAVKHLNAESCFDSRVSRLLDKSLTPEQKVSLVQPYVAPEKLKAYETLARGHFLRPNGLETFSCEIAGLSVDRSNVKY